MRPARARSRRPTFRSISASTSARVNLRLHERAHTRRFLYRYGVALQSIPPILTRSGADFERHVEDRIDALSSRTAAITCQKLHCGKLATEEAAFAGEDQNALVVEQAQALPPGTVLFLFQPRLQAKGQVIWELGWLQAYDLYKLEAQAGDKHHLPQLDSQRTLQLTQSQGRT